MVSGADAKWDCSYIYLGQQGDSELTVAAGGQVSSVYALLAESPGSTANITVTGPGSQWTNGFRLYLGSRGNASLLIQAGGRVDSFDCRIGEYTGGTGTVTVSGVGTQWNNSAWLAVGERGSGTLRVEAGGRVTSGLGLIGSYSIATGKVTVSGAGSQWTTTDDLAVGSAGILNIVDGELVSVAGELAINIFARAGDGFVNMSSGGMLALNGEAADSLSQFLDLVVGTDAIRYWNAGNGAWSPLTSATYGEDYTLEFLTSGDLIGYTLLTVFAAEPTGDFDGDVDVDGADFLAWQRGESPAPHAAADLTAWQIRYGATSQNLATAAAPEAAASILMGIGATALLLLRRRPGRAAQRRVGVPLA